MKTAESQPSSPSLTRNNENVRRGAARPTTSTTIDPDSTPFTPYSRPHSTAGEHSESFSGAIYSPKPLKAWDRSSTAGLPLLCRALYHVLPALTGTGEKEGGASPPLFDYTGERLPSPTLRRLHSPPLLSRESASLPTPTLPPALIAHTRSLQNRTLEIPRARSASGIPKSAPPTILTPSPLESRRSRRSAAYEPFLSHAPPPIDSWIAVETLAREYRLLVKLPGFRRDAITLATRRRRILHVVADSWEPTGGHFERRISFGYDADLAHTLAEDVLACSIAAELTFVPIIFSSSLLLPLSPVRPFASTSKMPSNYGSVHSHILNGFDHHRIAYIITIIVLDTPITSINTASLMCIVSAPSHLRPAWVLNTHHL
ncbi:hypothetical protein JAAARDRAFT_193736 [Jaapia argillacea MUCL 33604]|uniref:Uncharacterized protein n=1 Tax=Jaapia argillacea MUCL 33604 TaxID=933084 RepID=A0A067Q1M6_9AGAM|nr:hypothetical protein JAAARDRAFT_193736 [Jaapia argillacea MUCL 33604]